MFTVQPEGGDTVEEALAHVQDALAAVSELLEDLGKPLAAAFCEDRGDDARVAGHDHQG